MPAVCSTVPVGQCWLQRVHTLVCVYARMRTVGSFLAVIYKRLEALAPLLQQYGNSNFGQQAVLAERLHLWTVRPTVTGLENQMVLLCAQVLGRLNNRNRLYLQKLLLVLVTN